MRSNRFGCLTSTGILAALITALAIAGYAYARGGSMYSPGPLSAQGGRTLGGVTSHAGTGSDCKACHTAPWESAKMADRCVACHTDIAKQMREVATVHGTLMHKDPNLGCRHCHPEHRGTDAALTAMEDASFPHEVVGFSLKGHQLTAAREPFTCKDCHHSDITTFTPDTCDACHRQMDLGFMTAHTLSFGSACLDCHDGVDRFGKNFDHNELAFKINGKHVGLACVQCHLNARRLGDFNAALQDCYSCHQKDEPHEGRFGLNCASCHTTDGWTPAKFDHNLAAFKLEGQHAEVRCESCHVNNQFKGTPQDCFSCHQQNDAHNGKYGKDCSVCHDPSSWDHVSFDHNSSKFPLTGAHASVACEKCHSTGQFAGLSTACSSCHKDPVFHAGMFGLNCVACHTTDNWSAIYKGPHPGIADEGGRGVNHGGGSCRSCHTQTLSTATCTQCHSGNPGGDQGGGGHD
jgi:cytochrome c3-like protein